MRTSYYDVNDIPTLCADGYSAVTYAYEKRKISVKAYEDMMGAPINDKNGICRVEYTKGKPTAYFNAEGEEVSGDQE